MASYTPFQVTITNVAGALFDGMAELITVPSVDGTATILAHHEPLIALLEKGTVTVVNKEGEAKIFSIESGVLEVSNNRAIVIT